MRLRLTDAALADVEAIRDYIAARDFAASLRVVEQIARSLDVLSHYPQIGHSGIVPDTLELTVPGLPYVVVFQLSIGQEDELVILRVYHAARDRD